MKKRPCPLATVSSRWPPLPPVRCAVKGLRSCSRAPWKELCAACISAVLQRWPGQCGSRWGKGRCRWANAEGWGGYLFMLSRLAAGAAWAHGPHIGHYACLTRFPARFVGGDGATCQRTDVLARPLHRPARRLRRRRARVTGTGPRWCPARPRASATPPAPAGTLGAPAAPPPPPPAVTCGGGGGTRATVQASCGSRWPRRTVLAVRGAATAPPAHASTHLQVGRHKVAGADARLAPATAPGGRGGAAGVTRRGTGTARARTSGGSGRQCSLPSQQQQPSSPALTGGPQTPPGPPTAGGPTPFQTARA